MNSPACILSNAIGRTEKLQPCTGIELRPLRIQAVFGPLKVEFICCAASGPIPAFSTCCRVTRSELDCGHFFHYRKYRQLQAGFDKYITPKRLQIYGDAICYLKADRLWNASTLGLSDLLSSLAVGRQAAVAVSGRQLNPSTIAAAAVSKGRRHKMR